MVSSSLDLTGLENSGRGKKVLVVTTIDLTAQCFLRRKFEAMLACGYEVTLACTLFMSCRKMLLLASSQKNCTLF